MVQSRDELSALLAYLFESDIREHPILPCQRQLLLEAVKRWTCIVDQRGEKVCGEEQNNRAGDTGSAG